MSGGLKACVCVMLCGGVLLHGGVADGDDQHGEMIYIIFRAANSSFPFLGVSCLWDTETVVCSFKCILKSYLIMWLYKKSSVANKFLESNSICCTVILKCSIPFTLFHCKHL